MRKDVKWLVAVIGSLLILEIGARVFVVELERKVTNDELDLMIKLQSFEELEINPNILVIGNSRAAMSIDTRQFGVKTDGTYHAYNFALTGASLWTMKNVFYYSLERFNKIDTLIIGIDQDSFGKYKEIEIDPETGRIPKLFGLTRTFKYSKELSAKSIKEILLSWGQTISQLYYLRSSVRTIVFETINDLFKKKILPSPSGDRHLSYLTKHGYYNGSLNNDYTLAQFIRNSNADTIAFAKSYHKDFYFTNFDETIFKDIIDKAREHKVEVIVYIPPAKLASFRKEKNLHNYIRFLEKYVKPKNIVDLTNLFQGREENYMDFSHIRHTGVEECTNLLKERIK